MSSDDFDSAEEYRRELAHQFEREMDEAGSSALGVLLGVMAGCAALGAVCVWLYEFWQHPDGPRMIVGGACGIAAVVVAHYVIKKLIQRGIRLRYAKRMMIE